MSLSLAKKSLQLVESSDFKGKKVNLKRKSDSNNSTKSLNIDTVCSRSKKKSNSASSDNLKTFLKLHKQLRKNKNQDYTEQNLKQLEVLTKNVPVEDKKVVKFFNRATNNKDLKIDKVEAESGSVFTEEDFAAFEKEYNFD